MVEDFSSQTRRLSVGILTDDKGKQRGMAGKRPAKWNEEQQTPAFFLVFRPCSSFYASRPAWLFPGQSTFRQAEAQQKSKE